MSYRPIPDSVGWLMSANDESVQWQHFILCVQDQCNYWLACGVPSEEVANPLEWTKESDLQNLSTVVSWWPKDAPASHRHPTLYGMLYSLRTPQGNKAKTFEEALGDYVDRVKVWMLANKKNVDNPNESKEERDARLNRERVARYRLRHAPGSDDPEMDALLKAAKAADHNAVEGRKWLKGEIQRAKSDMDAAIARAKLERVDRVQRGEQAVAQAEAQALAAKTALDNFNINK